MFLNCIISYLRLAKNSVKRLPLIHHEIHSQSLGSKQRESSDLVHPSKLSGSPVKYLAWALGGKMSNIIHVNGQEWIGVKRRDGETDKLRLGSISRLKPAQHTEGTKSVCSHSKRSASPEFMN